MQTVLVVSGKGNGNGNEAVGKMEMETESVYRNGMGWEWERNHGSGREWESKYCYRTPLVQKRSNVRQKARKQQQQQQQFRWVDGCSTVSTDVYRFQTECLGCMVVVMSLCRYVLVTESITLGF